MGIGPSYVTRELEDLIEAGLVVKLDNGNFAYSMKTLQIAERFRRQRHYDCIQQLWYGLSYVG